jgi:hypothetical protein
VTDRPRHLRWPDWPVGAAGAWSLALAVVGSWWGLGGAGFPFGRNDPRADEVGSLFGTAEPASMGAALAVLGVLGGSLAALVLRDGLDRWARIAMPLAWALSAFLLVVVPDIRVVQNFAYLFFGYTGHWDGALLFMVFCMAGGGLWAATAVACHRRVRHACLACGRHRSIESVRRTPRWGPWATYSAVAFALPYPIVRLAWALGIPLGVPAGTLGDPDAGLRAGAFLLGGLALGGGVLTIGLVRRWGEVFPRWLPLVGGRDVPVWFAVIPATWAALVLSQAGLRILVWSVTGDAGITADNWGTGAPGLFWLPWGVTLGAAAFAYRQRRRGPCRVCGGSPPRRSSAQRHFAQGVAGVDVQGARRRERPGDAGERGFVQVGVATIERTDPAGHGQVESFHPGG